MENKNQTLEGFWDFLGGEGAFTNLLTILEKVGLELRGEIDDYFKRYNKEEV
jgi:type II restriction enzyme